MTLYLVHVPWAETQMGWWPSRIWDIGPEFTAANCSHSDTGPAKLPKPRLHREKGPLQAHWWLILHLHELRPRPCRDCTDKTFCRFSCHKGIAKGREQSLECSRLKLLVEMSSSHALVRTIWSLASERAWWQGFCLRVWRNGETNCETMWLSYELPFL